MHSHEHENVTSAHARIAVFGCDRLLVRDPTASLCTYRVQMKCKKKSKFVLRTTLNCKDA